MMRPLYIFRHIACEGPGYLGEVLERHNVPARLIRIDAGDSIPDSLQGCSGLVFMGGSMSVNDPLPWIGQELELISKARAVDMPVLGHCLGGQLISKALGGEITRNPQREIGWHPVRSSNTASATRWLAGLAHQNTLFHWHGETFSIPEGAELVLENDICAHQAFAIGNTLALQCHVEMTAAMVREWATLYQQEIAEPAGAVQSALEMTTDLDARIEAAQQVADILYARWLEPVLNQ
jgi:GMP synthase-like glutamine amidotransferase